MIRIMEKQFDVVVVGGGHAGAEAALAACRAGASALLLTHSESAIGRMSCNPAIGGIGKGHLVKEIDALGGAMAQAADDSGIQCRRLNSSRGAAVRATRMQTDRELYRRAMRFAIAESPVQIAECAADDILIRNGRAAGVRAGGDLFSAAAVVLTAGTFFGRRFAHRRKTNTRRTGGRFRFFASRPKVARIEFAGRTTQNRHAAAIRRREY